MTKVMVAVGGEWLTQNSKEYFIMIFRGRNTSVKKSQNTGIDCASPIVLSNDHRIDLDTTTPALGHPIKSSNNLVCISVQLEMCSINFSLKMGMTRHIKLLIFFYSEIYEGQEDGSAMIFSPYPNNEIIQVPPVEALEHVIKQQGMAENPLSLGSFPLEKRIEVFRLANDFAANEMCEEKLFPYYFDEKFEAKKLPNSHEISHITDKLVFNRTDIEQLRYREVLPATPGNANNAPDFQGTIKISELESLKRANKAKLSTLLKILHHLREVTEKDILRCDLLAYSSILEYKPSKLIADECYKKYKYTKSDSAMRKRLTKLSGTIMKAYEVNLPMPPKNLKIYQNDPAQYFDNLNDDLNEILTTVKKIKKPVRSASIPSET